MSYHTTFTGELAIEPPLNWTEIQRSPSWPGHPSFTDRGFARDFYGAHLHITESTVDTADGVLIRRECRKVTIEGDELSAHPVLNSLRRLAGDFGATHAFIGRLTAEGEENTDIWRIRIDGREVVIDRPAIVWPGDDRALTIIATTISHACGGEVGECVKIAERVIRDLGDGLNRK